jgi:hypothetical protein
MKDETKGAYARGSLPGLKELFKQVDKQPAQKRQEAQGLNTCTNSECNRWTENKGRCEICRGGRANA